MYSKNDYRYYLEHRASQSDDFLMHYGVKGMRWHKHKAKQWNKGSKVASGVKKAAENLDLFGVTPTVLWTEYNAGQKQAQENAKKDRKRRLRSRKRKKTGQTGTVKRRDKGVGGRPIGW